MTSETAGIELRAATEADRGRIAKIWHAGASLPGVGPATLPSFAALRQRVDEECAAGWLVQVAVRGDTVLGFAAVKPADRVLCELFVDPGERGSGIGTQLLRWAMEALPDGFMLYTRAGNERACRFYEHAGLRRLRTGLHPRFGDPIVFYGT
ncbi:GNAT family N-acetyltransferase [Aureimonas sp. AU4]|uniref:GNAT family N-acetyltransferase n=1 Tax=Aureimonas sp. AU4 TaxID=1638163 RepID=UPI0007838DEC|nr:GNAT family N-acetyltransferase [Aureimonas sp. AU4]